MTFSIPPEDVDLIVTYATEIAQRYSTVAHWGDGWNDAYTLAETCLRQAYERGLEREREHTRRWTDTTPTEPGLYWYCTPGCKHAPHLIQLQEWVNEGLVAYLIEEQGRRWIELEPRGYWLPVKPPDPPEEV